jgi:hypothetical protein
MHQTDCEPVLDKMGIEYNPEDKFNNNIATLSKSHNHINV